MKAIPLALLAAMVLLMVAARFIPSPAIAGYVIAFAEAAIVGALADWFAVTALFRHPLGIPIPHTAIIPRRKDALADSLADFVREHFLNEQVLRHHLADTDLAAQVARWGIRHRGDLAETSVRFMRWMLEALGDPAYRRYLHERLIGRVKAEDVAPVAGRLLELMADNRHHQELFTEVLRMAAGFLDRNRDRIRAQIAAGSPWWLPGFIDDRIFDQMVERIQTQLLAMVLDPDHELRNEYDRAVRDFAHRLRESPETIEAIAETTQRLASDPTVQAYFGELFHEAGQLLTEYLKAPDGAARRAMRMIIGRLAVGALRDDALRVRFNEWLEDAAIYVVGTQGTAMTAIITETVHRWDGAETARRIELQVGRDLQFIRINGTLVGGLIGLILHAGAALLG